MKLARLAVWPVALAVVVSCAANDFSLLGKKKKGEKGGEASKTLANVKKTRPSPEGLGVEEISQQITVAQVSSTTCPKYPGNNSSSDDRMYVPDGPPRAYLDKNGKTRLIIPHLLTYAWVGSSLEDASLDCGTVVADSTQNPDANKLDDTAWPWAVYRLDDDRAMTLYHMEYHPRAHPGAHQCPQGDGAYDNDVCPWYSAITWGIAEDGIRFGHPAGPANVAARAPETGYPRKKGGLGYSDHSNIMKNPKDGKYYVAALSRGLHDGDGIGVCMLRSDDLTDATSWKIYTESGSYDGSGHEGSRCKKVLPSGAVVPGSLTYSSFYKRFILLVFGVPDGRDDGFYMYLSKNDDLTQWTEPVQVLDSRLPWGLNGKIKNSAMEAYPSFLPFEATNSGNFDVTGEEAYLYWVRWKAQDVSGVRDVMRVKVRFFKDAEEIENPTAPMKGLYRLEGGGFYANGQGRYCGISSMEQLRGCGWTAPFDDLGPFYTHASMIDDGQCQCGLATANNANNAAVPPGRGCYRNDDTGFFSNGAGQSCVFLGPYINDMCGTQDFFSLPKRNDHGSNQLQDPCILPAGCYWDGKAGHYSNGKGQSCPFLQDWMQEICGHVDFTRLPKFDGHGGNKVNPPCRETGQPANPPANPQPPANPPPLASGCYRIGSGGYFSNGTGQSCTLLGPNLINNCGTSDFNALTARNDHGGNQDQGACILPKTCYRIGGGGYYSNGQGQSCPFLGGQMQGICGTTDFNSLRELPSHGGNAMNGQCQ